MHSRDRVTSSTNDLTIHPKGKLVLEGKRNEISFRSPVYRCFALGNSVYVASVKRRIYIYIYVYICV